MLTKIRLKNFRNYRSLEVRLGPGITALIGANGQGKTNLLEAVYFLAILRSFRTSRTRELLAWQTRNFVIFGEVTRSNISHALGVEYGQQRRLRLDGSNVSRASEFIRSFYAVAFVPEDIELIKGPAGERRRFVDITMTQLAPDYLTLLQDYDKALRSRNQVLRSADVRPKVLAAFDQVLIRTGAQLIARRADCFARLDRYLAAAAQELLPPESNFSVSYQPAVGNGRDCQAADLEPLIQDALRDQFERDRIRGFTHCGPHRDDFQVMLNEKPLNSYGSEGQCRLAALILKLAKARYFLDHKEADEVILLVDDVIGELDQRGRHAFFQSLALADQTLLACTDAAGIANLQTTARYLVADGTLQPVDDDTKD